ncbi:hypothetical protein B0H15DRAFT_794212, partial [Mycena belliarum]
QKEEDRDEAHLVKNVEPLLEQAEKILNETNGVIKGADADYRLSNKASRDSDMHDHKATPEEQRLTPARRWSRRSVVRTIGWARDKLDSFPNLAKRDRGPLLEALGQPLTQIVGGVGLLLAGVLNLSAASLAVSGCSAC